MQSDASKNYKIPKNKQLDAKCVYKMYDYEVMPVTLQVSPSKSCIVKVLKKYQNKKSS